MQRDPVLRLPSELVTACLGWLSLKGRIAASHVSWSWRDTALSDRNLWNEYTVQDWTGRVDWQGGLVAMLDRSNPVPFRLICSKDLPDALVDVLLQHMHRMQLLRSNNIQHVTVRRLMAQDAPMLQVFSFYSYWDTVIHFPSPRRAPCLRDVRLGRFTMASDDVFGAMRSFSGELDNEHSFPRPLVHFFPNLTELYLHGITQASLASLSPLPRSITSMSLFSAHAVLIDYANFFRGCETASLSNLRVHSAVSISPAVRYFMHKVHQPWELHLGMQKDVRLCGPGANYMIHLHSRLSLAREPEVLSLLHHISKLSLPIADYANLYQLSAWGRTLPTLKQLVVGIQVRGGTPEVAASVFNTAPPIEAPRLECVSFRVDGKERYAPWAIPQMPPVVRSLAGAQLEDIVILAAYPRYLETADLSCLAGLARAVSVVEVDQFVVVPQEEE